MSGFSYSGSELEIFAHATNWKAYIRAQLREYLIGDVLEVGAGIGSNTESLRDGRQRRWVCLEPDAALAARIQVNGCEVRIGMLADLPAYELFDCILYCDVLEHIEDDRTELALVAKHLRSGGALAVLSPAYPWLYSPFDQVIGHFRRYTRRGMRELSPAQLRLDKLISLDAGGLLALAANRLLLRSAHPTAGQIQFWDRVLVPISRVVDRLFGHRWGKSILAVWRNYG